MRETTAVNTVLAAADSKEASEERAVFAEQEMLFVVKLYKLDEAGSAATLNVELKPGI